jgi:hypothetical protein
MIRMPLRVDAQRSRRIVGQPEDVFIPVGVAHPSPRTVADDHLMQFDPQTVRSSVGPSDDHVLRRRRLVQ